MINLDKHKEYYRDYYYITLGIKDWETHYHLYTKNEEVSRSKLFEKLESLSLDFKNKKVLIVGAGTGAEVFSLFLHKTRDVYGIEPDPRAYEILCSKADQISFPKTQVFKGTAESLPFPNNTFDVAICYSVIEHVQDVTKSLQEIVRVLKTGAKAFISTPDYNYPYEGHYKQYAPTFMGKMITKLFLRAMGRNPSFCDTLNFVTKRSLDKILRNINSINFMRVFTPYNKINPKNLKERIVSLILFVFDRTLNIQKNQEIIIIKK